MTENEKAQIAQLRNAGNGYKKIARILGISVNTIKSYCRRNERGKESSEKKGDAQPHDSTTVCENCGQLIHQIPKQKRKRFCCDKCRNQWWNAHLDQVKRKANYEFICACCKKPFTVYGNAHRKYCSHACYIEGRYGGGSHE